MRLKRADLLQTALANRDLVRLTRGFDDVTAKGYVLAVGRAYFLVALVSDQLRFDGFACLRVKDLKSIDADPYRTFSEAALKQRGLRRPRVPRLTMDTARTILESACAICPLVTLHREEVDPEVCHIGQVVSTNRTQVALLEISPHAVWDQTATSYPLREITRIDFGGSYEEALLLVGGQSGVPYL
jgi:hypothetical protein